MGRLVNINVSQSVGSSYTSYVERSSQGFVIETGDLFIWQNCVIQVSDLWNPVYDNTNAEMMSPCKCVVKNVLPQVSVFYTGHSDLYVGKELNFPVEFIAVAVGRRYVEPPPEPPPPPPLPDTDKFRTMAA